MNRYWLSLNILIGIALLFMGLVIAPQLALSTVVELMPIATSVTPTATMTSTTTITPTVTITSTPTFTPTVTSITPMPTFTSTPTFTSPPTFTPTPTFTSPPTFTPTPTSTPTVTSITSTPTTTILPGTVRFAVIGDYGADSPAEADVADLIESRGPDFIITVGDNNYPDGEAETIDANIGQYYHEYIYPYVGDYGDGASNNLFFPALGNHDWNTLSCEGDSCSGAHFDYFTLPGNERYYDFVWGPLHFFVIDSDPREPDGISSGSRQGVWLQDKLATSTAPWKIVYMHHPPYSSGWHGSDPILQWPYKQWGVHAVFSGHDHHYERIIQDDQLYFVNGLGGSSRRECETPILGSQRCYNENHGAMFVEVTDEEINFQFINSAKELIDSYTLQANSLPIVTPTPASSITLGSLADAYVKEKNPDENYGDETSLQTDTDPNEIAYIKFDLGRFKNAQIISANLRLWVSTDDLSDSQDIHEIKLVNDTTWKEERLTYNNRPSLEDSLGLIYPTERGSRIDLDLSASAAENVGQFFSIAIETDNDDELHLYAKESKIKQPELIIGYNGVLLTPTITPTPTSTPTLTPTATNTPTYIHLPIITR